MDSSLSLIICTYKRPAALLTLLYSVAKQSRLPDEVLVIDGSPDDASKEALAQENFGFRLKYLQAAPEQRGLTRQRNLGIERLSPDCEIVAFLDDDLELMPDYFKSILETYQQHPEAVGVGGIDVKNCAWHAVKPGGQYPIFSHFTFDGWVIPEPARYKLRKGLGLMSMLPPGQIPPCGHGRSSFPPSGGVYPVDHFMGGIASYKKTLLETLRFSTWFEGYGLYEDMDFTIRASRHGALLVDTAAQVLHHHVPEGRPNQFRYGQMVVRNGWYVWRLKHPEPGVWNITRWHLITLLLAGIRLGHVITGRGERLAAGSEWAGRMWAWLQLWFQKPRIER